MHDVVTISSTPKSYFPPDDLLPAITLTNRPQTTDTTSWPLKSDSETWLPQNDNSPPPLTRRAPSAALQKSAFSKMTSLSESNPPSMDSGLGTNNRWLFNANGQLVDVNSDAGTAGWDLADEIVRLNIGDVAGESGDDAPIRTPPKSKLSNTIVQLTETSPLETSSSDSLDSPPSSEHQITISHSRGSSTDTTESSSQESALSVASNTMLSHSPLNNGPPSELKERPHSFSGPGLDAADGQLQQQQQQWPQYREPGPAGEQLSYPSLANNTVSVHRPQAQPHPQLFDYRSASQSIDYNLQQRNFSPLSHTSMGNAAPGAPTYVPNRPNNGVPIQYRQPPRGYPQQQGLIPSPPGMPYPSHTAHMSLGNSQQLYDMMLTGPPQDHPAVSRVQQQHNIFRGAHHHSASDPSALRDPSQLPLMGGNMQPYAPGMFPPSMGAPPPAMALYPNQFYGQDTYARQDAQVMARLQPQYSGPYGIIPQQMDSGLHSPSSATSGGQNGPSANNRKLGLYKTELCRSWEEKGTCRYGAKCQFAHGEDELRKVSRHPKTFWVSGSCPYGKRCCFIHTELPTSGGAPVPGGTPENAPPSARPDGRARSMSTNSDPAEPVSILARISAKRNQEPPTNSSTPVDVSSTNGYQFTRPPTGSLRVDTALDAPTIKQNKSAYPAFASNGVLLPSADHSRGAKSPAPVTAGPDLGRHNNARIEIVGYNQRMNQNGTPPSNTNVRHSFNGSEDASFTPSQPVPGHSYNLSSGDNTVPSSQQPSRGNGHVRAGSAGNWGSFARSNHLSSASYSHAPAAGDASINSPWSTTELTMGTSRLHEKAWA
ncbi:hypothetical protein IW261DRAFT_1553149 [Armillaria novae-zelandiae]|uniref:C3H1-type domain-containing protein n=1 Tax=Armillaria novae-zelandiae TaxID=153914 RepID=A0AA39NXJ0_9AGAR|nr:hypothetical protein IW261DRAFT_1553149 [Armillaria novae-zelandiae]